MNSPILVPIVALIIWSLVMLAWMMVIRLPALKRKGVEISKASGGRPGILDTVLDEKDQWPAHNYIHLMEQPTLFYALALSLVMLGAGGGWNVVLAWAYVILRILHSIVQATFNRIAVRFPLFLFSSLVLAAMAVQAVRALMTIGLI